MHTKFHAHLTFARLRPSYCMLANFTNRHSRLCTKHQNVALKLKMLKQKKIVETENPDAFIRLKTDDQIKAKLNGMSKQRVTYEFWKKAEVEVKKRTGETKVIKKMVLISEEKESDAFALAFLEEISEFREHAKRVSTQYKAQRTLKENLKDGHVAIHLDFADDYWCRSQEEIQSAYWNTLIVTLHPAVVYFRQAEKVKVKSFVFVSNEIRHDAKFILALLKKLIPHVKLLVSNAKHCHFFSDSPTSQYRNKTIFKLISHHKKYFGLEATWNYSEVGHGKGPCDPIGGTAKRQADMAVRNGKVIIQDAADFYSWASSEGGCIACLRGCIACITCSLVLKIMKKAKTFWLT